MELITLKMAAFHLGEPVPDASWNGAIVDLISSSCAFPAMTSQKCLT